MADKRNICRAVTLYNNYIPTICRKPDWGYCAFGTVDGIDVSENILLSDGTRVTEEIWEQQKTWRHQLEGKYAAQKIYVVRYDDVDIEREFWEDDRLPFFFFCRIQCGRDKMPFLKDRSKFEKRLNINGKTAGITYLTYDNSDLFVVIKAIDYESGAGLIHLIHKNINLAMKIDTKCSLKNSFTIMAVRYGWLNKMEKAKRDELDQKKIDTVYIKLMEREGGNIDEIAKQIENQLEGVTVLKLPVLGSDDAIISLSSVGWGSFLNLYQSDHGIFGDCSSESIYHSNAAGIVTQICLKEAENLYDISQVELIEDNVEESDTEYEIQVNQLKHKLKDLKEKPNELDIIWNTLPKFSGKVFIDYVFFPLVKAMDTLLDLMLKQQKDSLDKEPFYDFLTGFCLYVQNTILSDRHVTQTLGFNMKIYDIPVKLNAFYNAYLYRVSEILNVGKKCDYTFIAFPGMDDIVSVKELYKGVLEERRLLKVEIPEYSFYEVHEMVIILTHETAHYAGRVFRNRKERTGFVLKSYTHIYINYVENFLGSKFEETLSQEMEERLTNLLSVLLTREYNAEYLQNIKYPGLESEALAIRNKIKADYLAELLPNIQDAMNDIVNQAISKVFSPVLYEMEEEQKSRLLQNIKEASVYFMENPIRENTQTYSYTVLEKFQYLYEESFADLMSILLLHLSLEEYVTGIISSARYQKMPLEQLMNSDVMLRIAAVIGSIVKPQDGNAKEQEDFVAKWKKDISKCGEDEDWEKVVSQALWLWTKDSFEDEKTSSNEYINNVFCALKSDNIVLQYAAEYLQVCMNNITDNELFDDAGMINGIEEIREIYKVYSGAKDCTGEEQIIEMMNFINSYRNDLLLP